MSVLDFARWAGWNAGEGKRGPKLVQPETLKKLHTPVISMPEKEGAAPGTPSHGKYALVGVNCSQPGRRMRSFTMAVQTRRISLTSGLTRSAISRWFWSRTSADRRLTSAGCARLRAVRKVRSAESAERRASDDVD